MAIKKCDECGNEISTKAEKCPHCGAPQELAVEREELRKFVAERKTSVPEKPNVKEHKGKRGGHKWLYFFLGVIVGVALFTMLIVAIMFWQLNVIPNKYLIEVREHLNSLTLTDNSKGSYEEAIVGKWNSIDGIGCFFEFYDDGKCVIEMVPMSFMIGGIPGTYEIKGKMLNIMLADIAFGNFVDVDELAQDLLDLPDGVDLPEKKGLSEEFRRLSLEIIEIGKQRMVLTNMDGEESNWRRVYTP